MSDKAIKQGFIFYEGVSQIDGHTPVVGVITGIITPSRNVKTGDVLQSWILRQDIAPHTAVKEGLDEAICGSCKYRAGKGCYVKTWQAPNQVWKAYKRGFYNYFHRGYIPHLGQKKLRLGAYGDPAAVPYIIWHHLTKLSKGHMGYTHQMDLVDDRWAKLVMASADNPFERYVYQQRGFRTFSVVESIDDINQGEIFCPATDEGGNKSKCESCGLCSGKSFPNDVRKSIAVVAHGSDHTVRKALAAKEKAVNGLTISKDLLTLSY